MRETGSDEALSRPLVRVRADSELALASVLGLGSGHGVGLGGTHSLRAGVLLGLVLGVVIVLALLGSGATL